MRRALAAFLTVAVLLGTSPLHADQPALTAAEHFEEGKRAYDQKEYDRAASSWQKAYDVGKDPFYLFNIGQAHRQAGHWQAALDAYQAYLDAAPKAKNRRIVLKHIREMKREIAAAPPPAPEPPPIPEEVPVPVPAPTPPPRRPERDELPLAPREVVTPNSRPGRNLQLAGLVTGGAGLALSITGIVLGVNAASAREDLEDAAREGAVWGPEFEDLDSRRKRNTALSAVALTLGITAMATGGVLFLIGTKKNRPVELRPAVGPGQAEITVQVRF
jgi:tetratricopeptide (TPR) repeat protein